MPLLLLRDFFSINDHDVFAINFWDKRKKVCCPPLLIMGNVFKLHMRLTEVSVKLNLSFIKNTVKAY